MRLLLLLALSTYPAFVIAGDADRFAGDYGHDATATVDDVVWTVEAVGDHWRIVRTADGEAHAAHRLQARGRATFWDRMGWPADTATDADCLSWGEKPASLADLLTDTPAAAAAPGEEAGLGVLCRVPPASRARIDWLASHAGDWFYYDPIAGVMGVRRLR